MKEMKIGTHQVVIYTNVDELPVWRYIRFNKLALIDAYSGSSMEEIDAHFQNLYLMAKHNQEKKMRDEINNLRQSIYFTLEEIDTSMMCFSALVFSIDGKEHHDLSDEGIQRIQHLLKDGNHRTLKEITEEIKKKTLKNT